MADQQVVNHHPSQLTRKVVRKGLQAVQHTSNTSTTGTREETKQPLSCKRTTVTMHQKKPLHPTQPRVKPSDKPLHSRPVMQATVKAHHAHAPVHAKQQSGSATGGTTAEVTSGKSSQMTQEQIVSTPRSPPLMPRKHIQHQEPLTQLQGPHLSPAERQRVITQLTRPPSELDQATHIIDELQTAVNELSQTVIDLQAENTRLNQRIDELEQQHSEDVFSSIISSVEAIDASMTAEQAPREPSRTVSQKEYDDLMEKLKLALQKQLRLECELSMMRAPTTASHQTTPS
eukprot:m.172122 g.172122  ORF g.172122 m.172122 type:complete len:288 (+) comp14570_c0_seq3:354-1217(+)